MHGTSISGQDDRDEMGSASSPLASSQDWLASHRASTPATRGRVRAVPTAHGVGQAGGLANRSGAGDLDVVIYSARKWCRLALAATRRSFSPCSFRRGSRPPQPVRAPSWSTTLTASSPSSQQPASLGYLQSQRDAMTGAVGAHTNRPELVAVHGYDTKFAMHALRLGVQASSCSRQAGSTLRCRRPSATPATGAARRGRARGGGRQGRRGRGQAHRPAQTPRPYPTSPIVRGLTMAAPLTPGLLGTLTKGPGDHLLMPPPARCRVNRRRTRPVRTLRLRSPDESSLEGVQPYIAQPIIRTQVR